jgi:hypothetical protein
MPQLKNKHSSTFRYISTFFFLILMCGSQAFQFSHLHHFHEGDTLAFEASYHPHWGLWLNILQPINMVRKGLHILLTTGTTMKTKRIAILHGRNPAIL